MRRKTMRRKPWLITVLVACAVLVFATPASAVLFGEQDGDAHPQVGLVVFYDKSSTPLHRCTGTLLADTVLLTAGHCTDGTASAQVWFDAGPIPLGTWEGGSCRGHTGYPCTGGDSKGKPQTYPGFSFDNFPDTGDVGVVVLRTAITDVPYATLAPIGYLDELARKRGTKDTTFKIVGYGLQGTRPDIIALRERYRAEVSLVTLKSALTDGYNVQVTSDPGEGTGRGGLCFGDSGGGLFHPKTSLQITAVNSFVLNLECMGAGFSYRVDREPILDWINSFLG